MAYAVTPQDFGAAGDDSTDDTRALDAAAAVAKAQNRPLRIPPGIYRRWGTALDLTGHSLTVDGHGATIKQMTANIPVIKLGHAYQNISGLRAVYTAPAPATDTGANCFEFWHAQHGSYRDLQAGSGARGFCSPTGNYDDGIVNSNNFFFSNSCDNLVVSGFAISGLAINGGTGSVIDNLYVRNNPNGTRLPCTGPAVEVKVADEMVFNQLNVEWLLAPTADVLMFESSGNIKVSALHFEQVDLTAWGSTFVKASDRAKVNIDGVTMTFCNVSNAGTHSLFAHYADSWFDVSGFWQHDNTVAGTFVLDNVAGATTGAFYGRNVDLSLFTGTVAGEKAAPLQVVREVNGNRFVWQQGGRTHTTGTAAPTAGTWGQGDTVWNTTPAAGGAPGWVCVTAGAPGTWKAMPGLV